MFATRESEVSLANGALSTVLFQGEVGQEDLLDSNIFLVDSSLLTRDETRDVDSASKLGI